MVLYYVVATLYVLACLLLAICVLLQQGKGGDIASAFGGSSSQQAFGARAGATLLTRATTILGAIFMLGALGLAIVSRAGTAGSVVSGLQAPAAPHAAPATPPLTIPTTTPSAAPAQTPAPQATTGKVTPAPATTTAPASTGRRGGGL